MNFQFDAEQRQLAETVGRVLDDCSELRTADVDGAIWEALAGIGLFALLVPETHGGMDLVLADLSLAIERLGGALAPPLVADTLIATDIIRRFGTAALRDHLLPKIASGAARIALASAESGPDFPGESRIFVNGAGLAGRTTATAGAVGADWFLVLAAEDGEQILVPVAREAPGLNIGAQDGLDPSMGFGALRFDGVLFDRSALRSSNQHGGAAARLLDVAPAVYSALQTGIAARMLETSVEYARTREQFGQPIGAFQAIKHRCADMAVALEAARSAAYYALWAISDDAPDARRASSMAKAYCGDVARDACNDAIQIHGGMGFTWELGLHRSLRRAKMLEHRFGDQEWHYERVTSETLAAAGARDDGE